MASGPFEKWSRCRPPPAWTLTGPLRASMSMLPLQRARLSGPFQVCALVDGCLHREQVEGGLLRGADDEIDGPVAVVGPLPRACSLENRTRGALVARPRHQARGDGVVVPVPSNDRHSAMPRQVQLQV